MPARPTRSLPPPRGPHPWLGPLLALVACQTAPPPPEAPPETPPEAPIGESSDTQSGKAGEGQPALEPELETLIGRLYAAFCFEAGAEPDWLTQRELFHPDCRFLGPVTPGRQPRSESLEQFLAGFKSYARGAERATTGLYERIVDLDLWRYGGSAQARVAFEGHLPGQLPRVNRGIDALQLVETPDGWRVVGFQSQFERPGLAWPLE